MVYRLSKHSSGDSIIMNIEWIYENLVTIIVILFTCDREYYTDISSDRGINECIAKQGIATDNVIILRRTISKDGRSRAFINDQAISVGLYLPL